jgi:hypothetical protein
MGDVADEFQRQRVACGAPKAEQRIARPGANAGCAVFVLHIGKHRAVATSEAKMAVVDRNFMVVLPVWSLLIVIILNRVERQVYAPVLFMDFPATGIR